MHARHRAAVMLVAVVALLMAAPATASADPPAPTNYRSTVTGADGELGGTTLDVLGGDSYLVLDVADGQEVAVPGYDDEPYLRVDGDGTVEVNVRSPARWLNDARYGEAEVSIPPQADSGAPPQWEQVADGGTYAWHDHRIHWMGFDLPPPVDPSAGSAQHVDDWEVPLEVDGEQAAFTGTLEWLPDESSLLPIIGIVAVLLAGVLALGRGRRPAIDFIAIGVVATLAAVVGLAGTVGLPPGAQGQLLDVILPAIALLALAAAVVRHRQHPTQGAMLAGLAGLPLLVWGITGWAALTSPLLPSPLPDLMVRVAVAAAVFTGFAGLLSVVPVLLSRPDVDALLASERDDPG